MAIKESDVLNFFDFFIHPNPTEVRVFHPTKYPQGKMIFAKDKQEYLNLIRQFNENELVDVYIGLNDKVGGGSKSNVMSASQIFIEIDEHDCKKPEEYPKILKFFSDNNIEIGMSGFSGGGFHFYIPHRTVEFPNDIERENYGRTLHAVRRALIDNNIDVDLKVFEIARVGRVLGSFNHKRNEQSTIDFIHPDIESARENNNEALNKIIIKYKEDEKESINESALDLLDKYKLSTDHKWIKELMESDIVIQPGQKRNDIFLKNCAIACSQKMNKQEALIIGREVIKSLKGCTLSAFMGWLDKCYRGDLYEIYKNEFNSNLLKHKILLTHYPLNEEERKENRQYAEKKDITSDFEKTFTIIGQAKQFMETRPYFYDRAQLWWVWNHDKYKWELVDETDMLISISTALQIDTVKSKQRTEILNAMKQVGRQYEPKPIKPTWIQFHDVIVDCETGEEFTPSPEYFVANPLPYKLNGGEETPVMDKIFTEWVGEEKRDLLYEIIAFCTIPDYPIHRIFCLLGSGMNGKSVFLKLIKKFIGLDNICTTELHRLMSSRFEVTILHKKLVCLIGETDFNEMSSTSVIKSLSGQDSISMEYKNKMPFSTVNYAKIIIATNNLPATVDKTIGWYRRWCIIDFPNQFTEKIDILSTIPEEEYNALARKCLRLTKELLARKTFTAEGSLDQRIEDYENKSNPLDKFIKENLVEEADDYVWKWEFQNRLDEWCDHNRFRKMSETFIGKKLKSMGIESGKRSADVMGENAGKRWMAWLGFKWK